MRSLGSVGLDGTTGRASLHTLFSTFPRGRPGAGLLLLRAAVGITAASEGLFCLGEISSSSGHSAAEWTFGVALIVSGAALVLGCLTPIAGFLAALCFLAIYLKWVPGFATGAHDASVLAFGGMVAAISIVLIGPGAFSLDAYLFGRREIVIPPSVHPPEP